MLIPQLDLRRGESLIDTMDSVEDTKVRARIRQHSGAMSPPFRSLARPCRSLRSVFGDVLTTRGGSSQGNNGERGELVITNLRLIWWSHKNRKTNLSVGYNCMISINARNTTSRLNGDTQVPPAPRPSTRCVRQRPVIVWRRTTRVLLLATEV